MSVSEIMYRSAHYPMWSPVVWEPVCPDRPLGRLSRITSRYFHLSPIGPKLASPTLPVGLFSTSLNSTRTLTFTTPNNSFSPFIIHHQMTFPNILFSFIFLFCFFLVHTCVISYQSAPYTSSSFTKRCINYDKQTIICQEYFNNNIVLVLWYKCITILCNVICLMVS